jgi:LacI family transcriptional regulator
MSSPSTRDTARVPTVYDVAAHAGVSIATVSRVLRRPEQVREATRDRVLESVRALGYAPSASARGLAARRTGVIGLFLPEIDAVADLVELPSEDEPLVRIARDDAEIHDRAPELYFDEVLRGAQLEAWRTGFVLLVGVGQGHDPEVIVRDMIGRVDGLVVVARSVPDEVLEQVSGRVPIVLIAGERADDAYDHVTVANTEGMAALAAHVVSTLGARAPLYVTGPTGSPDATDRFAGFVQGLASAGIDASALPVLQGDFSRSRARELARTLLDADALPRAIVCGNDQTALGIHDVLTAEGVRMPEDVILTGFDGIAEAGAVSPRLTTVHQPIEDLGRAAVRMMVDRLAAPDAPPRSRRLPVTVLLRESSEGRAAAEA